MKIVVYGAGAVGTWLGVHLSRAGADVTFIARGATFDWLSQSPMELRSPDGTLRIDAHVAHTIPDDADLVIFATKTLGLVDLPELPATTTILTTQNSVEMPHLAVEKYGPEHVIPGVVRSFLTRIAPRNHLPRRQYSNPHLRQSPPSYPGSYRPTRRNLIENTYHSDRSGQYPRRCVGQGALRHHLRRPRGPHEPTHRRTPHHLPG